MYERRKALPPEMVTAPVGRRSAPPVVQAPVTNSQMIEVVKEVVHEEELQQVQEILSVDVEPQIASVEAVAPTQETTEAVETPVLSKTKPVAKRKA